MGPGNTELLSTYEKRNLPQYKTELGNCLSQTVLVCTLSFDFLPRALPCSQLFTNRSSGFAGVLPFVWCHEDLCGGKPVALVG